MSILKSKIALVSGGASGIGAAVARTIVAAGGKVVIGDIADSQGRELAADLGNAATYTQLDVSKIEQWRSAVRLAESHFGGLNVLVNNAGIINAGPLGQYSEADFSRLIAVNLMGTFLGMTASVETLKRFAPSSIINMSSVAGLIGVAGFHGYCATKFGIRGLTKSASLELGSSGIRVNSVHPGLVRTPMTAGIPDSAATNVLGRLADPREVAEVVEFLASDKSSFSTGGEFIVDAGETAGKEVPKPASLV